MAKPQPKKPGTSVATKSRDSLVLVQDNAPDYIKQTGNRGSENVTTNDLIIPRLELIQLISPIVIKGDPLYQKEAEAGGYLNSVTRKLYGDEVQVVPVHFSVQYLVWRDRKRAKELKIKADGGFFGAFNTMGEAKQRMDEEGGEKAAIEVIDTPQHLCLLLDRDTWEVDEIMISMPRTKAKVSRQWNTLIRMNGGDRFSRVYTLGSTTQQKDDQTFYNMTVSPQSGFPSKDLYAKAESLYAKIAAGARVTMDATGLETGSAPDDDGNGRM